MSVFEKGIGQGCVTELHDGQGARKYLNREERSRFVRAAENSAPDIRAFCLLLHHTGCRLSEALGVTLRHINRAERQIILRTLKRHRPEPVYRTLPVPPELIDQLSRPSSPGSHDHETAPLWHWHRSTACAKVKLVMARAGIIGGHATTRGIRHGFGVAAAMAKIPPPVIQRWMGHTSLKTTAIYMDIIGPEEHVLAERLWQSETSSPALTIATEPVLGSAQPL